MPSSNQDRSVAVDGDAPDILKRLEAYGSLVSECNRYGLLVRNAERNRHTVRPHIYARVKDEYKERSETLEQEQQEQKEFLRTELEKILEKRRALNERCRLESDRLEELDFRVRVGEWPEEEVQESRTKLKEDLLEITKALAETQEVVKRFEQVGLHAQVSAVPEGEGDGAGDQPEHGQDDFLILEEDSPPAEENSPIVNCPPGLQAGASEAGAGQARGLEEVDGSGTFHEDVFGYLVALDGSRRGERFPLISAEMTVGSSPDLDVRLADSGIARLHVRIVYRDGKHFIETVEEPGSCRVNGVKRDKAELKDGDVLSLGKVKMQVEYAREANA